MSGAVRIELPRRRTVTNETPKLRLTNATRHNLKDLAIQIPLGRFVCVTGVSGSGKTTLIREVLLPALQARLRRDALEPVSTEAEAPDNDPGDSLSDPADEAVLQGAEQIGRVILVDQSPLGRTPRSNPAVYLGAFDEIRDFFAETPQARQRGISASAFSFNSKQGQCETCRGAGFEKIEMQFLSDVFIRCPDCAGSRYRPFILEVRAEPQKKSAEPTATSRSAASGAVTGALNIAELLDSTVDDAIAFLARFPISRPAARATSTLTLLQQVGLGYLRLGQPINTLSGGESQRLKLASHLTEFVHNRAKVEKPTLFLFDEPTTGLHFEDIRILLQAFQSLVDAGHSLVVIEHNLEVIKSADWVLDIGPGAGSRGGQLVAEGTPETIAANPLSVTGKALCDSKVIGV
jgi:excinuclease ABC subunit A